MGSTSAALRVLVDRDLLLAITSYQRGYPEPIVELACASLSDRDPRGKTSGCLVRAAISKKSVYLLDLLYRRFTATPIRRKQRWLLGFQHVWLYAIRHGNHAITDWLRSKPELLGNDADEVMLFAIERDDREIIQWLLQHTPLTIAHVLRVVRTGNLDLFKWLETTVEELPSSPRVFEVAASNGHIDFVKYLHDHPKAQGCTAKAVLNAGSVEVVRFFSEHGYEGLTSAAIDTAARRGKLDVLRFLLDSGLEGCTKNTMDEAAAAGHLDVVKWLHENRTEGCTTAAMDRAAARGALDVVQFLHYTRRDGCTKLALKKAAVNNRIAVVRFLLNHRCEGSTFKTLGEVARRGHLEMFMILANSWHTFRYHYTLGMARRRGRAKMIKYLLDVQPIDPAKCNVPRCRCIVIKKGKLLL